MGAGAEPPDPLTLTTALGWCEFMGGYNIPDMRGERHAVRTCHETTFGFCSFNRPTFHEITLRQAGLPQVSHENLQGIAGARFYTGRICFLSSN